MDSFISPSKRANANLLPPLVTGRSRRTSARFPASRSVINVPEKKNCNFNSATYRDKTYKSISPMNMKPKIKLKETRPTIFSLQNLVLGTLLGEGKTSRVLRAAVGNQEFAVKIMPMAEKKYFEIEWEILQKLNSPFIVKGHGKLDDTENNYLLLELVEGGDLFHLMRKRRLRINEIAFIAAEVVIALNYLHDNGIIYRDIKPENIMLDSNKHIKLVDFGYSKIISDERPGTVCGSPEYTAPEMIRRQGYSFSVDWWGLGILLYELACGHPPFQGENFKDISKNIMQGELVFTRQVDPQCKDLIRKLLAPEPQTRLGCLKNKVEDIKHHKFFRGINWEAIAERRLPSPINIVEN